MFEPRSVKCSSAWEYPRPFFGVRKAKKPVLRESALAPSSLPNGIYGSTIAGTSRFCYGGAGKLPLGGA